MGVGAALAHPAPSFNLRPLPPIEHEEQCHRQFRPPAELEKQRPELGVVPYAVSAGVGILVPEPLGGGGVLEPEGGVDADAQGAGAMFVFLEAVDDGQVGDGARLACLVDDLEDGWSI